MRRAGLLLCSVLAVCAAGPALAQPVAPPRAAPAAASPLAAGLQAAAASDYVAAEKALLAIIATQSSDRAAALGALARVRLEQGRFDEADKLALQAAGSPDQRLVATALRGEIFAAQGKVDEALKLLTPSKDAPGVGGRRVRLVLGELLVRAGRRADAEPILLKLADEYGSDAIPSRRADANVLVGRVKREEAFDFDAAEKLAKEAVSVNPAHTGAFAVRAGIALRDTDLAAANAAIAAGLAIDPNDLELWSMRAAARFLADDKAGFEAAKREVFARNKEFSQAYGIIGD